MVNVGDDGEISDVIHGVGGVIARVVDRISGITTAALLLSSSSVPMRCEATCEMSRGERQFVVKKKARRKIDAPSNKTYGNCMLVPHCNQKRTAGNRANTRFLLVADCQHEKLCTCYAQAAVHQLGIFQRSLGDPQKLLKKPSFDH